MNKKFDRIEFDRNNFRAVRQTLDVDNIGQLIKIMQAAEYLELNVYISNTPEGGEGYIVNLELWGPLVED